MKIDNLSGPKLVVAVIAVWLANAAIDVLTSFLITSGVLSALSVWGSLQ